MSTTYKVSKQNQLIDLNGTMVNFNLTFTATSANNLPFEAVVMDQAGLDTNPNIDFKQVTDGTISGNIISDKNVYQNFFLVLKAPQETSINVTIDIKPLPPRPQLSPPPASPPKSSSINWKYILIFFAILCTGYLVWKYMGKNKSVYVTAKPQSPMISVPHTPERPMYSRPQVDLSQYKPKDSRVDSRVDSRNADLIARLNGMRR